MAAGYKQMNEQEYDRIKLLLAVDTLTREQVSVIMKRSAPTIAQIARSSSWEQYKERQRGYTQASYARRGRDQNGRPIVGFANGTPQTTESLQEAVNAITAIESDTTAVAPGKKLGRKPITYGNNEAVVRTLEEKNARSLERIAFALEELVKEWRAKPNKVVK